MVVSITHISNSDSSTSKTTATVSSAQAQLLKQLLSGKKISQHFHSQCQKNRNFIFRSAFYTESAKKSRATIIKKTIKPINAASHSQIDHEYGTSTRIDDGAVKKIADVRFIKF